MKICNFNGLVKSQRLTCLEVTIHEVLITRGILQKQQTHNTLTGFGVN